MKKLTAILILLVSIFGIFPESSHATETGSFVVTAYYSPLPNQSAYIMGSYAAEIRMNGEGIRGASGKGVFSGMLAAPQTYSFGTKIYLAGLGIGEVADRGGAIVAKGERGFQHDRIDVWMGYGEEGLRRAMYWGNRTVKGYITYRDSASTININNHFAPVWATSGLKQIPTSTVSSTAISNIYSLGIGSHSNSEIVKQLQTTLKSNNFYSGELDGNYSSIESIIYSFQLENGLVVNENTTGAGYWGAITRSLFLKKYQNGTLKAPQTIFDIAANVVEEAVVVPVVIEVEVEIIEEVEVVEEKIEIDIFSDTLTTSDEFTRLQEILTEIGVYEGEIDGEYSSTRATVYEYQVSKELVENENSVGAGVYGPNTRATLKQDYEDFHNAIKQAAEEKIRIEQEKIELEAKKLELEILDKEKDIITQERKTELVEQFIGLEKIAEDEAESRVSHIGLLQLGDVSQSVRDLQIIMKELGYLDAKDTAIYGEQTKQSVFNYQLDRGLVSNETDIGAGIYGPVTGRQIKNDLKTSYLESLLFENSISSEELIEHGIDMF